MSGEADEFVGGAEVISFDALPEIRTVPGASEGGYLRYLKNWVGGPEGHVNPNFGTGALISGDSSVGFMRLSVGCRQKGVHSHGVAEIYVILKGQIEGYDGVGDKHFAGPMDCVYIPKGVPHGIRNTGTQDLDLLWVHDGMEKKSNITYYYDEASTPKIGGVAVIKFFDLEPHWSAPRARESPYLRFMASYVGGQDGLINYNPQQAYVSDKCALGLLVIWPESEQVPLSLQSAYCYVVMEGRAVVKTVKRKTQQTLGRLDALWVTAGTVHSFRNPGSEPLWLLWTTGTPQCTDTICYQT